MLQFPDSGVVENEASKEKSDEPESEEYCEPESEEYCEPEEQEEHEELKKSESDEKSPDYESVSVSTTISDKVAASNLLRPQLKKASDLYCQNGPSKIEIKKSSPTPNTTNLRVGKLTPVTSTSKEAETFCLFKGFGNITKDILIEQSDSGTTTTIAPENETETEVLSQQFNENDGDSIREVEVKYPKRSKSETDSDTDFGDSVKRTKTKGKQRLKMENGTKFPKGGKVKREQRLNRKPENPVISVCHLCGHLAKSRTSMYYHHMFVHQQSRKYSCPICEKGFCQRVGLRMHIRTHTGEKPFSCPTCNKSFSQQGSLKHHETTHTGQKSHQCDICQKLFSFKASLARHKLRAHAEKPLQLFPCELCKKVFRHAGFLRTHLKLVHVHGVPPMRAQPRSRNPLAPNIQKTVARFKEPVVYKVCDICDETFSLQSQLYQHDRTVHSIFRPYACFKCPKRFAQSADAKAHFLESHGITVYPLGSKEVDTKPDETDSTDEVEENAEKKNLKQPEPIVTVKGAILIGEQAIGTNIYFKRVQCVNDANSTYQNVKMVVIKRDAIPEIIKPSIIKNLSHQTATLNPSSQPKTKVLIIRKKPSTSGGSASQSESNFSNLLTLANVSSRNPTTIAVEPSYKINAGTDINKPGLVLDTITIEKSPSSS